jgi:glutamyl-tRNA synthetase
VDRAKCILSDETFTEDILKIDIRLRDKAEIARRGGAMYQPWYTAKNPVKEYFPFTLEYSFVSDVETEGYLASEYDCALLNGTEVSFTDVFAGGYSQDVSSVLGDFPIARDEGGAGYTLAVVVDDLLSGVTEVVRGDDLLSATPAQILIAEKLLPWAASKSSSGVKIPAYCHVPLVVGSDGRRLAKRHGDTRVASYRAAGMTPEKIIGRIAASCGWCDEGLAMKLHELMDVFDLSAIPRNAVVVT